LGINNNNKKLFEEVNLVLFGCSCKAEERIALETNCFQECTLVFDNVKNIRLFLVGPEMSGSREAVKTIALPPRPTDEAKRQLVISLFKGTCIEFFRTYKSLLVPTTPTLAALINPGFGNWENQSENILSRYGLLLSWLPDLYFLTGSNIPVISLCANDYADLNGEISVIAGIMAANLIIKPSENPFSFASTLIPPHVSPLAPSTIGEYSRGNSFYYAFQGSDPCRRVNVLKREGKAMSEVETVKSFLLHLQMIKSSFLSHLFIKPVSINWEPEGTNQEKGTCDEKSGNALLTDDSPEISIPSASLPPIPQQIEATKGV
jgi:hypothetical protein